MNDDIKSCDHGLCRITLLYSEKSSFALTGAEEELHYLTHDSA